MDANTQDQGTQGQATDQNTTATDQATPAKLYATREECEANKPADAPKSLRVYEVSKAGAVVGFIWARGYDAGLAAMARKDGYSLSTGTSAPVTKETIAAKLATFTDDELLALGLSRKPVKGGKK